MSIYTANNTFMETATATAADPYITKDIDLSKPIMQDITSLFQKLKVKDEQGNINKKYNPCDYKFNNSIIHVNDNIYLCSFRYMKSDIVDFKNQFKLRYPKQLEIPEMWGTYKFILDKKENPNDFINTYSCKISQPKITNNNQFYANRGVMFTGIDYNKNIWLNTFKSDWSDSKIILALLRLEDDTFSLYDNIGYIVNNEDLSSWEDARLYKRHDGNIYMYFMDIIRTNDRFSDINQGKILSEFKSNDRTYCKTKIEEKNVCVIVMEQQIDIMKHNGKWTIDTVTHEYMANNDKLAPKVFCSIAQIDGSQEIKNDDIKPSYKLFDKNYSPFVYDNQDYFSYAISKKHKIYSYDKPTKEHLNSNNCVLINGNNDQIDIFRDLMSIRFDKKTEENKQESVIHSISQNTPAILWDQYNNEYIAVGHMRVKHLLTNVVIKNEDFNQNVNDMPINDFNMTPVNKSLQEFLQAQYDDFDKGRIVLHRETYFMFFYTFIPTKDNKGFIINKISNCFMPEYNNRKYTLCFAISLIFLNNNKLCLTYGEGDIKSRSLIFTKNYIENMLKPVNTYTNQNYQFIMMPVNFTEDEMSLHDYIKESLINNKNTCIDIGKVNEYIETINSNIDNRLNFNKCTKITL